MAARSGERYGVCVGCHRGRRSNAGTPSIWCHHSIVTRLAAAHRAIAAPADMAALPALARFTPFATTWRPVLDCATFLARDSDEVMLLGEA